MLARLRSLKAASGWRKTAGILTAVMLVIEAVLILILIISSAKSSGGLRGNHILYQDSCSSASTFNTIAHLLINALATGVLASSNFFMQVLNAPTHGDIDRVRGQGMTWADIGTPSFRNLRFMGWPKTAAWLVLALSSAPLHLFFNSAVFQSDDVRKEYRLAIAAEPFVHGAPWFLPGASLRSRGSLIPREHYNVSVLQKDVRSPPEYAARLAREGGEWKRLSPSECRSTYIYSRGLRGYGDVIIVVDSPEPGGWKRRDVFSGNKTFDRIWDEVGIPANAGNSLWHDAGYCHSEPGCNNLTGDAGGKSHWHTFSCYYLFGSSNWCYRAEDDNGSLGAEWRFDYIEREWIPSWEAVGFRTTPFNSMRVKFCVAQPVEEGCKVAISNILLAISLLSVSAKLAVSCCVYLFLSGSPLITPGDAVASFICRPDDTTRGRCTFARRDFEKLTGKTRFPRFWKRQYAPIRPTAVGDAALPRPPPRRWAPVRARWIAAVPITSLVLTYLPTAALLAALIYFFRMGYITNDGTQEPGFGRSSSSFVGNVGAISLLEISLYANLPQLALSLVTLQHNSLLTRMLAAREWASYSNTDPRHNFYRPLRVTAPARGSLQISTWRLQLPYRYGVPLLAAGALLHWLVSNCVYVLVMEGGYVQTRNSMDPKADAAGLAEDVALTIGYSLRAMVVTMVVGGVAGCVPLMLGMRRLAGGMPVVGSNSMAISAACHVVVLPPGPRWEGECRRSDRRGGGSRRGLAAAGCWGARFAA